MAAKRNTGLGQPENLSDLAIPGLRLGWTPAVQLVDEAVDIGPAQAAKSYMSAAAILEAARNQAPTRRIPATVSYRRTPPSPMRWIRPAWPSSGLARKRSG